MVTNVTSLTGNGLKDWLIQRLTAIYLAIFSIFLLGFIVAHPQMQYDDWFALFHRASFQVASLMAVFALTLHAWVGLWTVTTDYLHCTAIRLSAQSLILLVLLGQLIGGFMTIWGR
jgi:succinate dehydrogenase / fumarate reductase membrane anchor subunit